MKRIISILAALAVVICANAQRPRDVYYTVKKDLSVYVYNANTGESYRLENASKAFNIGIDDDHNVYVLAGEYSAGLGLYHNYVVYKNGKPYQSFYDSGNQFFSSMAMKVVGNDVVVAGVESRRFNSKGFEARMVGYVNKVRVYQTDWERKSLKRDQFKGFSSIVGSGSKTRVLPSNNYNSMYESDTDSRVYYIAAVDYVDGYIYTTGWGEREYTETPLGYTKQYLVRRCPRVWKNGKQIVQQYENRTGAGLNIAVMRSGQNILTSGHVREHVCGWDGSKDMYLDESRNSQIVKEAVIYGGMADGVPMFTRMFIDMDGSLFYVNSHRDGNQRPILLGGGKCSDVVSVGNDFYVLNTSTKKVYKYSSSNWMKEEYDVFYEATVSSDVLSSSLLAVHK